MQIQLKQAEVIEALKQYIARQGFILAGKTVDVSFTAGRGTTGMSADVSIEEQAELPLDLTGDSAETEVARPVLTVVATGEANVNAIADTAPEKKTSSLFV